MRKKLLFIPLLIILSAGCAHLESPAALKAQVNKIEGLEPFRNTDRILILAPHPDDESIGCAGIIQKALKTGAEVKVAYLTNGDHNQVAFIVYEKRLTLRRGEFIHMGEVRRNEAIKAMELLGIKKDDLIFLGYPDFGTFTIFSQYWQSAKPFRSLLTRISSVPYKENLSYGAPYTGENILKDLKKVLLDYKPTKIFVSHPSDVNVDHKTFYLFLEVALADLAKEISRPKVYPYLIHCLGWPLPRHYHPELRLTPHKKFFGSQVRWSQIELTPEEIEKKHRATLCYKSQTECSAFYLLTFVRKNELFGNFPEINLQGYPQQEYKDAGTGQVSYSLQDNSFVIRIKSSTKLSRKFSVLVYLFGYKKNADFASLPKIRILTRGEKFKVFNKRAMLKPEGMTLKLSAQELTLKVPLEVLGNPDFILASIRAHAVVLPVDVVSFRKINIK